MKYWFYSEGNILGPYEPAELLALPAFAEESLVCPETATGDSPGDWRPASQMAEIANVMSVGVGKTVTAGVMGGAYEYNTGFSATMRYFEDKEPGAGVSYGDLLDTIDNILGAYKEGQEAPAKAAPETDYDLAEKFDIRLSRIQEELEAARWEKNLLLEKIRMKDLEERKNRERIIELEARLKGELGRGEENVKELEQVRHLADLKESADTLRKLEEIKKEELALKEDIIPAPRPAAEAAPKAGPATGGPAPSQEVKPPEAQPRGLKSISSSGEITLEKNLGAPAQGEEPGLTRRSLKSLGQTQAPAYVYGNANYDKPLPAPEPAPPGAFKPENLEPLPQQAGGLVYDFTVVTPKQESSSQQFKIEPKAETSRGPAVPPASQTSRTMAPQAQPVKPPTFDFGIPQAKPAPAPAPAPAPQPQAQVQTGFQFSQAPAAAPAQFPNFTPQGAAPQPAASATAKAAGPEAQLAAAEAKPPAESPDKTVRLPASPQKAQPASKPQDRPRRGGRTAFIAILVAFASIAAGGLGFFFLGEGGSFSEVFMLNIGGKKKPAAMASQLEEKTPEAATPAARQPAAQPEQPAAQPEQPAAQPAQPEQPAQPAQPASENIRKALDIVKNYKLSGGRGTIATWFANSFLSGAAGGANEEWTATPLHGDILVVQYRLLRPKQDPLIYQFEVDAAKQDIVRGINNNAIELLDSGAQEKTASAEPAKKPQPKPKARRPSKPREIPILPLPDAPEAGTQAEQEPTGFENAQAEGSEEVKYLKAQESDEELF